MVTKIRFSSAPTLAHKVCEWPCTARWEEIGSSTAWVATHTHKYVMLHTQRAKRGKSTAHTFASMSVKLDVCEGGLLWKLTTNNRQSQ